MLALYKHVCGLGWIIDKVEHPYSKLTSCPTVQREYSVPSSTAYNPHPRIIRTPLFEPNSEGKLIKKAKKMLPRIIRTPVLKLILGEKKSGLYAVKDGILHLKPSTSNFYSGKTNDDYVKVNGTCYFVFNVQKCRITKS